MAAPALNQNAKAHGFYSELYSPAEVADLVALSVSRTLGDEIATMRVASRRVFEAISGPDVTTADLLVLVPILVSSLRAIAYMVRSDQLVNGAAGDSADVIAAALDDLSAELGLEL